MKKTMKIAALLLCAVMMTCLMVGFEIRGPLILMDKKTGKIWR